MDVSVWGKLNFKLVLDDKEGDYTFPNINIYMETALVDSFNKYQTCPTEYLKRSLDK